MTLWGPLAERFESRRPRKLLALDGGGIRGVLTLEILAEIERQLRELTAAGPDFRLCHYFDYVAGTSTGAIIAAGLARGMAVAELLTFYETLGPSMFDKQSLFQRLKAFYKREPLMEQLQAAFGAETDLGPENLQCLLMVVTRNVTTDSPWPISSNPLAKYNDQARPDCNLRIPLWQLVRASTAAPVFFPPEVVNWDPNDPDKAFVFVDGGVTPYNNPSFLLYRMATLPAYRLAWEQGEGALTLVSVGTGASSAAGSTPEAPDQNLLSNVAALPGALMHGALVDQDINCRTVGRCVYGAAIDRELGDMIPRDGSGGRIPGDQDQGRAFLYARYNADLSRDGLLRLGLSDVDPKTVQKLDAVEAIEDLRRIGRAQAREVQVPDFDPELSR